MPDPFSPFDIPLVRNLLAKRPLVFADIGAAGGIDPFLRKYEAGDAAVFVGFEPNPDEFSRLKPRQNVTFLPYAVSDVEGEAEFFLRATGSTLERPSTSDPVLPSIHVAVRTLAALVADRTLSGLDVVKVDAEGHDLHALRGAGSHLASDVLMVKTEFSFSRRWPGSHFASIDDLLTANGLALFGLQYYTSPVGEMGSGDALYLRSVESILDSGAAPDLQRERCVKLIALAHYIRNTEYAYVVARAARDCGLITADEMASTKAALHRQVYLPHAFGGAPVFDRVFHLLFAFALLLSGRRGRDKSLPKSNRLERYRLLFMGGNGWLRRRAQGNFEQAYASYRSRLRKKSDA